MEDLDEIGTEKVPEDARMTALWSARNRELRATRIVVFFIYVAELSLSQTHGISEGNPVGGIGETDH